MKNNPGNDYSNIWFAIICWLVALYFSTGFLFAVGFPPHVELSGDQKLYLALSIFFLLTPFFKKIKIWHFIELERELRHTKNELKDFKSEIRNNLSFISTSINTIGNQSNQVTFNLSGFGDPQELKQTLDRYSQPNTAAEAREIRTQLAEIDGEDRILALARTRIRLEYYIRELLGKNTIFSSSLQGKKFISLANLTRMFFDKYKDHTDLKEPMQYVLNVCNAAIHAQRVTQEQSSEALDIGAELLAILSELSKNPEV